MNWDNLQLFDSDYSLTLALHFLVPFLSVIAWFFIYILLPIIFVKLVLNIISKIILRLFPKKKTKSSTSSNPTILFRGQLGHTTPPETYTPPPPTVQEPYFWDTGKTGERYILESLKLLAGYKQLLSNCYIPKDDGTFTEIDVILIHESGIYVLESKNYSGWIFGNEEEKNWVQYLPVKGRSKKIAFFNPIIQNNIHLKWLRKYLDVGADFPLYSYIVFSDRCELKEITLTSGNHTVINRRVLPLQIRRNAEKAGVKLSISEIDSLYSKLYPLTQVTEEQKALHIKTVEEKKRSLQKDVVRKCPRCGGVLVLRTAKTGERAGKKFLGCSNYPKCRFIENIDSPSM